MTASLVRWVDGVPEVDAVRTFVPYRKQAEFLTSRARHRYFLAGRFAGKSWTCALDALLQAIINPGKPGLLAGRTEMDIKKILLPHLRTHLDTFRAATGVKLVKRFSAGDMVLELINGSVIHWRGWDQVDKCRGLDLAWANFDETEWGTVTDSSTLLETMLPAIRISCNRPGIAFFSSPNGARRATKLWLDKQSQVDTSYWLTHCSSYANPHVSPEVVESCKRSMSVRRYKTEILALPLRPHGVVFDGFAMARHGIDWNWRQHPDHLMVFGVDWGTNHAVAVAIQVDPVSGRWVVVDELVCEPQTRGHFREQVKRFIDGFGRVPFLIAADRAVVEENQWARGVWGPRKTFVLVCDSKHEQYKTTQIKYLQDWLDPVSTTDPKIRFANKLVRTFDGTTAPIIPALQQYSYKLDLDGNPTDVPRKDNITDHAVDAILYAITTSLRFKELHGGVLPSRVSYRGDDGAQQP